jgi:hypothetical protein
MSCSVPRGPRDRHGADRAGVAGPADRQAAVHHHAAADEAADVEIDEVAQAPRAAEDELGATGGGGVVLQVDREGERLGESRSDVDLAPGGDVGG